MTGFAKGFSPSNPSGETVSSVEPKEAKLRQLSGPKRPTPTVPLLLTMASLLMPARADSQPSKTPDTSPTATSQTNSLPQPFVLPDSIVEQLTRLQSETVTNAERAKIVMNAARYFQSLPPIEEKKLYIMGLADYCTEGDLGLPAIQSVANALTSLVLSKPQIISTNDPRLPEEKLALLVHYVPGVTTSVASEPFKAALKKYEDVDTARALNRGLKVRDLDGNEWSVERLVQEGKVVVIHFWAPWCLPCLKEIPDLKRIKQEFGDKVVVLGIHVKMNPEEEVDVDKLKRFIKEHGIDGPTVLDPDSKIYKSYDVVGIPASFYYGPNGSFAQRIDRSTRQQMLTALSKVGLELK